MKPIVYLPLAVGLIALWSLGTPLPASAGLTWSQIRGHDGWTDHAEKEHKDAGSLKVLKATIEGVQCWQGTGQTDAGVDAMLEVARDIEGTPEWATTANVTEAKILARSGPALEYYQLMDLPTWTMTKDRFWFVRGQTRKEGGTTIFSWEKLDEGGSHGDVYTTFVEEHEKAIEPPVNAGGWAFTPTDDGVEIQYYICTDSGGDVSQTLTNLGTASTLPDTVGDLVREARKREK